LTLSTITGVIGGTPAAVATKASYTVTASNASGNTTASLSITVNVAAPAGLSYTPGTTVYTVETTIPANLPTSTGGPATAYRVSPALPAGLTLDDATGIISGTPTVVAATANYTVTASNSAGSTTSTLTLTVNAAPLSANNINLIFVVSQDLAFQDQASGDISPSTANLTNKGLQ
jgi:PKD repeat protein